MSPFLRIFTVLAALFWSGFAHAQSDTEQDDRGYLQALLEDNLSGVGRDIRIIGFQGAFSSQATVAQITVADDDGIWLTMNDVVLNWQRASLLRGAININQISAQEIIIARTPTPVGGVPAPEASGFSLPELPVSVEIGVIKAEHVELAEPVIGQAAVVRLEGTAQLSGGEGSAQLDIVRTDGPTGALRLEGSYSNVTTQLDLALTVDEGEDGIAANLLDLPDRPAIGLIIAGSGPLSDFVADIDLSTDGKQRLTGQVELRDEMDQATSTPENPVSLKRFNAQIEGDIAPVLLPDYRDFFGDNVTLTAAGRRFSDGALDLETLALTTEALTLQGDLALSAKGWPERFTLTGRIADQNGAPVLLPMTGPKTQVQSADLAIGYNAENGEAWQANFTLNALTRDDMTLDTATVSAIGTLEHEDGTNVGRVDGNVTVDVQGIAPKSEPLAKAIGPALAGKLSFDWRQDTPLQISDIDLSGTNYQLVGSLSADDLANGVTVKTNGDVVLTASDLSQFAGLAGTPLTGAAKVALDGAVNLLGGAFDVKIKGDGADLGIGQARIDPLIAGASKLDIEAVRDDTGTRLERLNITTAQTTASVSADLKTDASNARFDVRIKDSAVVDPGLSGPATVVGTVNQTKDTWAVLADLTAPGGVDAAVDASIQITKDGPGLAKGTVTAKASSLSPYAQLVGQPITGAISATAKGSYDLATGNFEAEVDGTGTDLGLGQPALDSLIRGDSTYMVRLHRDDKNVVLLDALSISTPELTAQATGRADNGRNTLDFDLKLRDVGLLANGISGAGAASGTATLLDDTWQLAVAANGPGGANASVNGTVQADASRANLKIDGTVPLELANRIIQPRLLTGRAAFDLTLNGPLQLSSLAGNVQTTGARLALPTFGQAVEIDSASVVLSGARADVNVVTSVITGGQVTARGNISLDAPYQADLQINVDRVTLTDGNLFETTLDGTGTLRGPLTDGATLRADLTLGSTEIRISEIPPGTVPILEELRHINEPAAVRQTRAFAGLIIDTDPNGQTSRPYPIDITVRAPSQLFVRGRGLDAELGGTLRLTGTSANVVPVGEFELIRGRLDILGKRLTLTEGRVSMRGGFDPYVTFAAETQADDIVVRISLIGPASAPEVTFTSSPELPQDEVLARLLFGRNIAEISPLQALRLAAAVRTLAGKGGEGIVGKLRDNFALDDLDLTTDENGEATLKAGKYISENIYTDVEVGADGDTEINLNLSISPSLTARGTLGSDGKSSIGIFFERDY
ncbi:translocation/assembly module TamB domain-containing protein [Aliiroseovarius sp. S1339]|uniref:translocation/assembly module TamB domain-containing protein n=1 Tax=Aliiroseovarius sp. S1339 TaxID=2936990 RepID=UPI0020BE6D96|nr:translocation/assembly module TamB domain-containing protein [Aliiroseovarius sp. S1339]MCK8465164.1 translocation/assembly module TamB domain-containing protein [Aliiroseovarius sp. S1339]